ncbi:hypothetical protein [Salegentibacter chungangensis]|uniref:Lipoprotein n=1 Tax=Salegentibacter chungangensis TaxID=1335724 RepID=A0ABW3NSY9_9FLAO
MRIVLIFLLLLIISCKENKEQNSENFNERKERADKYNLNKKADSSKDNEPFIILDEESKKKIELNKPSIIVIQLDSLEIERVKKIDGEDNFYTAADDMVWYNSKLIEQSDSLNIPIIYSNNDYTEISAPNLTKRIVKDSTFSLFTYFYYDGKNLKREELFNLLKE